MPSLGTPVLENIVLLCNIPIFSSKVICDNKLSICLSVLATLLPVRQEENIIRISQLYGVSLFILEYLLSLIILNYSFLFQFHCTQHPGSNQASKDPGRVPCTVQVPEGHFADGGHHSLHFRDSPIRRP